MGYCLLMVCILLAIGRPFSRYADELIFYLGVIVGVGLVIRMFGGQKVGVARFIRLLYPAILFTAFYRMTGGMMFLVHDHFMDTQLSGFEQSIFGFEPSLYIDKYLLNPWVTDLLMGTYFSYYLMLPALLLPLFLWKKDEVIRQALAAISLTFFVGYLLFFLYPVEGPRWHYMDQYVHAVDGPIFRPLVEFIQAKGSVRGGCVPSTHVAVAIIVMVYAFRLSRPWGWLLAAINLGMAAGTVWGRYHYTTDVIVGVAIACGALWTVGRLAPLARVESTNRSNELLMGVPHVS